MNPICDHHSDCSHLFRPPFSCRITQLNKDDWNTWTHDDTWRETQDFWTLWTFSAFFFFFLQVVIFEPVLCVLLETFPPATYLWSRLRFFWPTNQVKNTVLHVTWGLLRPSSCNTPSCIVLKKKKDCIYYVDHFHVSIVRKICFLLSVIWSFNPRIPRILLLYGLFFRKNKKYQ